MSKYEVEISAWGNYFKGRCEIDKIMADFMLENQHKKTYKIKIKQITEAIQMDKIIDGVDVSECKHFGIDNMELCKINFDNNYFSNGIPCAEKCSNHPDCYYKQLQRLEQENEELKQLCDQKDELLNSTTRRGIELERENEQIKKDYAKLHIDFAKCNVENEQLKKSIDRIMQNKEIKTIDSEIALLNAELQQENKRLIARLRPLEDSYFKGLSSIEIAELAKKSIRITAENRKLEQALQEIRKIADETIDNRDPYIRMYAGEMYCRPIIEIINSVIGEKE